MATEVISVGGISTQFTTKCYPTTSKTRDKRAFDPVLVLEWKEHGKDEGYTLLEFAKERGFAERLGGKFLADIQLLVNANGKNLEFTIDPQEHKHWFSRLRQEIAQAMGKPDRASSIGLFFSDGTRLKGTSADLDRLNNSPPFSLVIKLVPDGEPVNVPPRPIYALPLKSWQQVEQERAAAAVAASESRSENSNNNSNDDEQSVEASKASKQLIQTLRERLVKQIPLVIASISSEDRDLEKIQEAMLALLLSPVFYGGEQEQRAFWKATRCSDMGSAINELSHDIACQLVESDLGPEADPELHGKALIGCNLWDDWRAKLKRLMRRKQRSYVRCPSVVVASAACQTDDDCSGILIESELLLPGSGGSESMNPIAQLISMSMEDPYVAPVASDVQSIAHKHGKKNKKKSYCIDECDDQPNHASIACAKRHSCYRRRARYQLDPNSTVCMLPSYQHCVTLKSKNKKLSKHGHHHHHNPSDQLVVAEIHEIASGIPSTVLTGAHLTASGTQEQQQISTELGTPPNAEAIGPSIEQERAWRAWESRYGAYQVGHPMYRPPPPGYYRGWHRGWRRRHHRYWPGYYDYPPPGPVFASGPPPPVVVARRPSLFSVNIGSQVEGGSVQSIEARRKKTGGQVEEESEDESSSAGATKRSRTKDDESSSAASSSSSSGSAGETPPNAPDGLCDECWCEMYPDCVNPYTGDACDGCIDGAGGWHTKELGREPGDPHFVPKPCPDCGCDKELYPKCVVPDGEECEKCQNRYGEHYYAYAPAGTVYRDDPNLPVPKVPRSVRNSVPDTVCSKCWCENYPNCIGLFNNKPCGRCRDKSTGAHSEDLVRRGGDPHFPSAPCPDCKCTNYPNCITRSGNACWNCRDDRSHFLGYHPYADLSPAPAVLGNQASIGKKHSHGKKHNATIKSSDHSVRGVNLMGDSQPPQPAQVAVCMACDAQSIECAVCGGKNKKKPIPLPSPSAYSASKQQPVPDLQSIECGNCDKKKKKKQPTPTPALVKTQMPSNAVSVSSSAGSMPDVGQAKIRVHYAANKPVDVEFRMQLGTSTEVLATRVSTDAVSGKTEYTALPVNSYRIVVIDPASGSQLAESVVNSMAQRNAYTLAFEAETGKPSWTTDERYEAEKRKLASIILESPEVAQMLKDEFQGVLLVPSDAAVARKQGAVNLDDYQSPSKTNLSAIFKPPQGGSATILSLSKKRYSFNQNNTWIWKEGAEKLTVQAIIPLAPGYSKAMAVIFDGLAEDVPSQ